MISYNYLLLLFDRGHTMYCVTSERTRVVGGWPYGCQGMGGHILALTISPFLLGTKSNASLCLIAKFVAQM